MLPEKWVAVEQQAATDRRRRVSAGRGGRANIRVWGAVGGGHQVHHNVWDGARARAFGRPHVEKAGGPFVFDEG